MTVIDITSRFKFSAISDDDVFLACPECDSPISWAVKSTKDMGITELVCLSDECEGRYSLKIEGKIL